MAPTYPQQYASNWEKLTNDDSCDKLDHNHIDPHPDQSSTYMIMIIIAMIMMIIAMIMLMTQPAKFLQSRSLHLLDIGTSQG